ncbi:MBOAT, membrane-bound O-acyltransferase family-domain-containing protein [Rhodocollybia butyracea]|uniref:MBOAT, membrane-bound O-acyltransferase family-domain-containing protein n=1 Tax=Rhodocollybia butyracea TaxID=206335 RepID=A0A9P5UA36_9AGAR|nr:MBOAT, membrane-bound O-acyltransferase family-domain-containing protein [Rhodocollybia butyracea]
MHDEIALSSTPAPAVLYHPFQSEENASKSTITNLTVEIPSITRNTSLPSESTRKQSRWGTLEFKFYYAVVAIVIPIMVWITVNLSNASQLNYSEYQSRLSQGWLFGRRVDNSDIQYRSFRNNIPLLTAVAIVSLLLKHAWVKLRRSISQSQSNIHLIPFNVAFSLVLLLGLHGSSTLKILAILTVNYLLVKISKRSKTSPMIIWIFNIGILFLNDRYHGYRFGEMHPALAYLDQPKYEGFYPRWHINFNITMLRLVSFSMDYYWACKQRDLVEVQVNSIGLTSLNEKQRQTTSHPEETYSFINYLAYALYPPLYIAGPIITFNDFMWQFRRPTDITRSFLLSYLFRFVGCLLTMEFILHFMYVVAIKDAKAWVGDTAAQIGMIGFWNLMIVWLKLLLPWRFFRLWALADGIDPPENMVRCMANNYSTFGFWRSWHRSYNLWLIRYIYVPLGGMKNVFVNSVLVYTFVALWHDLTFKLLAWGWLVSIFIVPEMLARYFLPVSRYSSVPWYRHICAFGAIFNILLMMVANLVGFVVGTDGIRFFFDQLFRTTSGLRFLTGVIFCLFVAAQIMFEYRQVCSSVFLNNNLTIISEKKSCGTVYIVAVKVEVVTLIMYQS